MRKHVGDVSEFMKFIADLTENEGISVELNIRTGYFGHLSVNDITMVEHWLDDIEVPYTRMEISNETWTLDFKLDDIKLQFWFKIHQTKEDKIAALLEKIRKLEEED